MQAKATPTERSGLASPSARRMPKPPKMVMKVAQKCPATPITMAASMMGSAVNRWEKKDTTKPA